ncbi:MAG TPA: T9SS type B sorting domain-containing protein [Flavobacteriales bacterium]|nr:T9SS type B sorting domain-containing protein [Flavobacteriales bacterium]HIA12659.1 T9SS type B sorting domain-containing protein [Flavobacteriales bacterium]
MFRAKYVVATAALITSLAICSTAKGQAPGCPNVTAGTDTVLPCATACTDISATFLETGLTTDYLVAPIPYAPPFSFTGGTQIFIGIDDIWSSSISLPFTFCFYGSSYTSMLVGTNGVLSFDLSLANGYCEWSFSATIPTPGPPTAGIYDNSINGAYHDIDPSVAGNINWAVLGTAPCRTMVINYFDVAHFLCTNLKTTQQIVLYETTNVIEVYIDDKPTCNFWNSGNAVIGIQNANGSAGVAPPGRNTGLWAASNEAWRFTPNGSANYVVDWYDGPTLVGTGATINVCPTDTTDYMVQVTYTNCNGTTVVETDTVNVVPTICGCIAYISNFSDPTCAGGCNGTATVAITDGVPPYTYSWAPSGGTSSTATGLCGGMGYVVTVIDSNFDTCYAALTMATSNLLTVDIPAFTNPTCSGAADGNAVATVAGGTAPYAYSWSPSGGGSSVGINLLGGVLYAVTVLDSLGCTGGDTITLYDPPAITASITSFVNPACGSSGFGQATVTASGGTGPYSYSWSPSGGNDSTGTNLAGEVLYTATVVDSMGCMASDTITLSNASALVAVITTAIAPTCDISTDGSVSVAVSGGTPGYTYIWIPSGGTSTTETGLSGGIQYTVAVEDANGCRDSADVTLTAPAPLTATISVTKPIICVGESVQLTVTPSGGTVAYSYLWTPVASPVATNVFSPTTNTTYDVVVTDANGCVTDTNISVLVNQLPNVMFSADVLDGCEPLTVEYTDATPGSQLCVWDVGDSIHTGCAPFTNTYDNPGSYTVQLTVTDTNGCTDVLVIPNYINVYPMPTADFTADPWVASIFMPTFEFTDQSADADCWKWDFNGLDSSFIPNPSFTFPQTDTGTFPVELWICTNFGCVDSITKFVTLKGDFIFFLPNSFTPNDDQINELFGIKGVGIKWENTNFWIYNRWGEMIFHSENGEGWDGKDEHGKKTVEQEVYIWLALVSELDGTLHKGIGHVTVLK